MKKIFVITIALIGFIFSACNDWLDVNPRTQVKKEVLLETQKGFRDVLTGAYIRLKNGNLYGGEMTWSTMEYLAQHWVVATGTTNAYLQAYNYTNGSVKDRFSTIFKTYYQAIADVNSLLEVIDEKKGIFTRENYELIKGEALGIRALCHLDVLRLWGPVPVGEISDDKILPYVKSVTNEIHDYSTYEQFVQLLLEDLNEAERLLEGVDPILKYSIADLQDETTCDVEDDFWIDRQVRMNYYGVLALKARLYFWTQDMKNAVLYAKKVIDAKDPSGKKMWVLATGITMESGDLACASESIFGLSVYDLGTKASSNFDLTGNGIHEQSFIMDYYAFPTGERTTDVRFDKQWTSLSKNGQSIYICRKFYQLSDNQMNELPLIRLAEMYFIVMEATSSTTEANGLFSEYASSRGIATADLSSNKLRTLTKEFNKEFYAEGQMFFFYKRVNATGSINYIPLNAERYVAPLPEREIVYNNK